MKKFAILVEKYGTALIEAKSEAEALEIVRDMDDTDFDWSEICNPTVTMEF